MSYLTRSLRDRPALSAPREEFREAPVVFLASFDCLAENVCIIAIVIPELKFRDVKRQIFLADFVIAANDAALEDRPEALNRLSVNRADDILPACMVYSGVRIFFIEMLIADPLIGAEQTYPIRDRFVNEASKRLGANIGDDASNHVSFALHCADDDCFSGASGPTFTAPAFVFVPILSETADESFVNFDNAAEFINVLDKSGSDFVAHHPCGAVRAEAQEPIDLERAHSLFAGEHQVDNAKPIFEGFICVLKDRVDQDREPITVRGAFLALPMPFAGREIIDSGITATRAANALWPSAGLQIGFAGIFVREQRVELRGGQLMNGFRAFGHGVISTIENYHV